LYFTCKQTENVYDYVLLIDPSYVRLIQLESALTVVHNILWLSAVLRCFKTYIGERKYATDENNMKYLKHSV